MCVFHFVSSFPFYVYIFLVFSWVVLLCVFTFCVPCCDVRYDFLMFTYTGVQHMVCFWFVCLRLVYPMLLISLDCPFVIAPSVFSNLYLLSILYVLLRNDVLDLCFILLYKNEDSPSRKVFSVLSSFFLVFVQYFVVFFVCKWRPWPWILFRFIRLKINQVN